MAVERQTPIIIGVGDIKNKSRGLEDPLEPVDLMLQATLRAINDTALSREVLEELQKSIDSLDVVATWTWPYINLPGLLSEKLGVQPHHRTYTSHGGHHPAKLLDEAARRISFGECRVALITGGEALASLSAYASAKMSPPASWTKLNQKYKPVLDSSQLGRGIGAIHQIGLPVHIYPLYENGFRAYRGQSIQENDIESAKLYAEFAKVAERNPMAWNYGELAATDKYIGTVTQRNRMICFPYLLLMNAFNNVNLAAACLLTSTDYARELGVPKSRWIYPLGGAGTRDSLNFWERPNFYSSPAMSMSLDATLEISGLSTDEIDLFDLYSCFPIVPKLACHYLGLPMTNQPRPITLLGGLTSFGGAGNNYSMHALAEMVRQLRKGRGCNGLVLANGGVMTYQHAVCLSSKPRRDKSPYPGENPLPDHLDDTLAPQVDKEAEGEAIIETYTVEYGRDGTPSRGYIIGRLKGNDHRFLANHGDEATLKQLSSSLQEQIGKAGLVRRDASTGRNLLTLANSIKL